MGSLCALILGGILGYTAASVVAAQAIRELKDVIARGAQMRRKEEEDERTKAAGTD